MTPNEVTLHIEPCIWGHVRRQWGKKDTWGGGELATVFQAQPLGLLNPDGVKQSAACLAE